MYFIRFWHTNIRETKKNVFWQFWVLEKFHMWLLMLAYFVSHIFFKDWRHHKQDAVADWYIVQQSTLLRLLHTYTLCSDKKRPGLDFSMNTPTNLPRVELFLIYNALSMDEWTKYLRRKQKNWFQYSVGFTLLSAHIQ